MDIGLQLEAWVGGRYSLSQLQRALPKCSFTDPSSDELDYIAGEDYKILVEGEGGSGTIWYAITREGLMYITEVEWRNNNA